MQSEKSNVSANDLSFSKRTKGRAATQALIFADDLNELSRMPVTALQITSEAEKINLRRKTIAFMILDALIIINIIILLWVAPIEKVFKSYKGIECRSKRWLVWCEIALPLSILSLVLDALTLS